ncbi:MAG: PTS sugar transporter subunit IIA [Thermoanaerobacteraceae bacterium]|nr:PTS sugar transporter subunit IIA [Thermoanaerobacteraceae bacterium]
MVHIILASHGDAAQGILSTAELICGKQTDITVISLVPGSGPNDFYHELENSINKLNATSEVIILTDLIGGTPTNEALRLAIGGQPMEIVTGLNLPMIIETILCRKGKNVLELAAIAEEAGKKGIMHLKVNE